MTKAILIDAKNREIKAIEYDSSRYENIYPLLSTEAHAVSIFEAVRLPSANDAVMVDEEGLFWLEGREDKPESVYGFALGANHIIAGNGLLIGADDEGETCAPMMNEAELAKWVRFVGPDELFAHLAKVYSTPPQIIAF